MSDPLELEDAQARLLDMVQATGTNHRIAPREAAGRVLSEPLVAAHTRPPRDLSAMDGYATAGDGPWALVGEARAGEAFGSALSPGEATRISTGAAMPPGADAVLIQEDASVDGETLTATDPPQGKWIRRAGLDFASGDILLPAGTRLGAGQLALAIASGAHEVAVFDRPRLAIIETGDELTLARDDPDALPASNGAMLAAMASTLPCDPRVPPPVPDRLDALAAAIDAARDADLLVFSGGASVGPHDLVKPALEAAGFTLDFWRVAIKPGKPLLVARRGAKIAIGLPGNPVSSFVTALLFVLPAIRRLCGLSDCLPRALPMPLAEDLPAGGRRREFLRARWDGDGLVSSAAQDSSALLPLARAQVLIDRAADAAPVAAGSVVDAIALDFVG